VTSRPNPANNPSDLGISVMNILFATPKPMPPEETGGMQSSGHELALSLAQRGHKVSFLCGLLEIGTLGIRARLVIKLLRRKALRDRLLGYPVWRARSARETIEYVADQIKPDIIVVMCGQVVPMALAARRTKIPLLLNLQNVELGDHGGSFAELGNIPCVANSRFTADRYRKTFSVEPKVIHPLIDWKKYRTETTRENVTFINPHPLKGVDLAIAVARHCPEIPFSFVESWRLWPGERGALGKLAEVPNIKLRAPVSDMRQIYGKCRILLTPSRWEEAYGRVVSEAQFSGIPVVASNRGGLPEAVGSGGILLDPDGPIDKWVSTVKRLWHDDAYYSKLSSAARSYSERPALNESYQLDMWEHAFAEAVKHGHCCSDSSSLVASDFV
jgi:glycosyltransferase involved in cell wall biosynthesis